MGTYKRHRFPPDIISYAVWLYYRFNLSHRDIEDLLAERGITVSREAIRLWCIKFVAIYTRRLKRKHRGFGDTFYIDEVFTGVPDHSDQRQAALSVASRGSGRLSSRCISAGQAGWCSSKTFLQKVIAQPWRRTQKNRDGQAA